MVDRAVAKLQALVRVPTVSDRDPSRVDTDAFDRLLDELRTQFPLLHEQLELTRVSSHGLLFRWPGAADTKPAMARTTFAVTTLEGSPALNVIASSATAGVNIRVMPGDTVDGVVAHLRRVVDDSEVRITVVESGEASPVSLVDEVFDLLAHVVAEHFPDAVVAPYVQAGATDSRHFTRICDHIYRFAPFRMDAAQRRAIHSYDEHLGVDAFLAGIDWYQGLIEGLPE